MSEPEQDLNAIEEGRVLETVSPDMRMLLDEFLEKEKCSYDDCKVYLYKFDNYFSGEKKALINTYHGQEPPDESEVGFKYGSGRYSFMIFPPTYVNGKKRKSPCARSYNFRLAKTYDTLRRETENLQGNQPQQMVVHQQGGGLRESMEMLRSLIDIVAPLIAARTPEPNENVAAMMNTQYKAMGEIMKQNALSNIDLLADMTRRIQEIEPGDNNMQPAEVEATEEERTSLFDEIKPILDTFLPAILQSGGTGNKITTGLVKGSPLFKRVMKDRLTIKQLIAYLDSSHGIGATDQVLQQLQINRPGKRRVVVNQQQEVPEVKKSKKIIKKKVNRSRRG